MVEDEPVVQKVHLWMLRKLGCRVDIAENGGKAIKMYPNDYDLILLDCHLPDIDGFEVAQQIRILENKKRIKKQIPIIMVSAYLQNELEPHCKLAKINEIIMKPVEIEKIESVLKSWL